MVGSSPVRVLLAEDEPKLVLAVQTLLELRGRAVVVGVSRRGEDAIERALALRPQLILLDAQLQGLDGISAGCSIRARWPAANIVVYSGDERALERARAAGLERTILKGAIADRLTQLIDQLQ